jgi:sialic acid synthase SpsE
MADDKEEMKIDGVSISLAIPPVFVAEISCNHLGELASAVTLAQRAKQAGADFVKFQCYQPEAMTLPGAFKLPMDSPWADLGDLYALYERAQTPYKWFSILAEACRQIRIPWFSSVFDEHGVKLLEQLGCPAYKIASAEIADLELIIAAARTGKPVIFSTGMANRQEILRAARCVRNHSPHQPIVLHCVSDYPTHIENSELAKLLELSHYFNFVGISDHSFGDQIPSAATALGVCMIEKHVRLDNPRGFSLDHACSMPLMQFGEMIARCKAIWQSIHSGHKEWNKQDHWLRRSLHVVRDIGEGEGFTRQNVRSIRPSGGVEPWRLEEVCTKVAPRKMLVGEPITEEILRWPRK